MIDKDWETWSTAQFVIACLRINRCMSGTLIHYVLTLAPWSYIFLQKQYEWNGTI